MERLDTQQWDSDLSRKAPSEYSSSIEEQKLLIPAAMEYDGDVHNNKKNDGFVALNIEELVAATDHWDSTASPRAQLVATKSLPRKGSQRSGGGGGGEGIAVAVIGGPSGRDKAPALGHFAVEGEVQGTPTAAGGSRCRRAASGRRPSPWRDPRRVLFVFASLSCMGTLILLYFTLSMGRVTTTGDADSR